MAAMEVFWADVKGWFCWGCGIDFLPGDECKCEQSDLARRLDTWTFPGDDLLPSNWGLVNIKQATLTFSAGSPSRHRQYSLLSNI